MLARLHTTLGAASRTSLSAFLIIPGLQGEGFFALGVGILDISGNRCPVIIKHVAANISMQLSRPSPPVTRPARSTISCHGRSRRRQGEILTVCAHRLPKIEHSTRLGDHVRDRLAMGWSPEQIAGRMKLEELDQGISTESIYRYVFSPAGRCDGLPSFRHNATSRCHFLLRLVMKTTVCVDTSPGATVTIDVRSSRLHAPCRLAGKV